MEPNPPSRASAWVWQHRSRARVFKHDLWFVASTRGAPWFRSAGTRPPDPRPRAPVHRGEDLPVEPISIGAAIPTRRRCSAPDGEAKAGGLRRSGIREDRRAGTPVPRLRVRQRGTRPLQHAMVALGTHSLQDRHTQPVRLPDWRDRYLNRWSPARCSRASPDRPDVASSDPRRYRPPPCSTATTGCQQRKGPRPAPTSPPTPPSWRAPSPTRRDQAFSMIVVPTDTPERAHAERGVAAVG